jgi:hypothetical protein
MPKAIKSPDDPEPIEEETFVKTVVPDHTDTTLIAFYHERGEPRVEQFPVIAWSIMAWDSPKPITAEAVDTPIYCLKLKTGLWVFTGDVTFSDEAKALEYGRSRAKARREQDA